MCPDQRDLVGYWSRSPKTESIPKALFSKLLILFTLVRYTWYFIIYLLLIFANYKNECGSIFFLSDLSICVIFSQWVYIFLGIKPIFYCVYVLHFYSMCVSSALLDIMLGILHVMPPNVCGISNNKKNGLTALEDTVRQHMTCLCPHRAVCFSILLCPFDLYLNLYPQFHQDSGNSSGFRQRGVLRNAITFKN